jgi:hypothetical protein
MMAKAPTAFHLAATIQIVSAQRRGRHVTIAEAHRTVREAALRVAQGTAGPETQLLVAKLQKVTGSSIAQLAMHAEDWAR